MDKFSHEDGLPFRLARSGPRPVDRRDAQPTLADQELDTRATTGVVYWEGSQRVTGTKDGLPIGGEAYVELTGYGPASTAGR